MNEIRSRITTTPYNNNSPEELNKMGADLALYLHQRVSWRIVQGFVNKWREIQKDVRACQRNVLDTKQCETCDNRFACWTSNWANWGCIDEYRKTP